MKNEEELFNELMVKVKKDYSKLIEVQLESYKELIMRPLGYTNEQLYETLTSKKEFNTERMFEYYSIYCHFKELIDNYDFVDTKTDFYNSEISKEDLTKMINYSGNLVYAVNAGFDSLIYREVFSDNLNDGFYEFLKYDLKGN